MEQIERAIAKLKEQRQSLEAKIRVHETERTELDTYMKEIQEKTKLLQVSIIESNKKLEQLVGTIAETENGFNKLVTAGKTLMEIVTKNMEEHEISFKIDS